MEQLSGVLLVATMDTKCEEALYLKSALNETEFAGAVMDSLKALMGPR